MNYSKKEIDDAIDNFKNGIKASRKNDLKCVKCRQAIQTAVDLAYNDAKRTMNGIKPDDRDAAKCEIVKALEDYFRKPALNETDFDRKHKDLCEIWTNAFAGSDIGTYGKAQKIINMSFKYLFCCDDARTTYDKYFKYAHMPLDSFTLEWIKRNVNVDVCKRQQLGKIATWSRLAYDNSNNSYNSYVFYRDKVRDHCKDLKISALELEFIIWPEIQSELAAEAFLFALEDGITPERKKKIVAMTLNDKYNEIRKRI